MKLSTIFELALILAAVDVSGATCCAGMAICTRSEGEGDDKICLEWTCPDGSPLFWAFGCCGYRPCNVFCCNCDPMPDGRVCRTQSSLTRDVLASQDTHDSMSDQEMFEVANVGGDGKMTLAEFVAYMAAPEQYPQAEAEAKFHL
ncbi:hypothetical protein BCR34DRAFT_583390 [Clohesyomyces aquaticus]|uniref:EF-hand domain-containing protein n=1 Tax=Clohesyomyces aquaticus TaxID=1231657 RepID=A0A1Y2A676_9PLEO|nr:hypothetical protein BCR34DRAFT_583390 [Clohesyomyces aquaticus]